MLPDDALLEVFDVFRNEAEWIKEWHTLVHVCQRWRNVVFGSPRRLGLRLVCTNRTPVKEMMGVWPPLPIVIWHDDYPTSSGDNIIAALKHYDRVCEIRLGPLPNSQWDKVLAEMQVPFWALTDLKLQSNNETAPVIPDSFLDGSAPRLRNLSLDRIPFPRLPKLLLSSSDLVKISLLNIPHSGYISPEAMATCLSLTRLAELDLAFLSPRSRPHRENRHPRPATHYLLPTLRHFIFVGVSEYLEDLVARIGAPHLDTLQIKFFHQLIFNTPELAHFIIRTPEFKAHKDAHVVFSHSGVSILVPGSVDRGLKLKISCRESDWQLGSLAQIFSSSFPHSLITSLERLAIYDDKRSPPHWKEEVENGQWLELLHPFTAVKDLYLFRGLPLRIAPALQELVGERATEVLPALQCLNLEGINPSVSLQKAINQFIVARQLSNFHLSLTGEIAIYQVPSRTCTLYFLSFESPICANTHVFGS
jgi:hypothetical protein